MTLDEIKDRINQYKLDYSESTHTAQVVRLEEIIKNLVEIAEDAKELKNLVSSQYNPENPYFVDEDLPVWRLLNKMHKSLGD